MVTLAHDPIDALVSGGHDLFHHVVGGLQVTPGNGFINRDVLLKRDLEAPGRACLKLEAACREPGR